MIKTDQEHFTAETASHAGMKGKQNEDRLLVTHFWAGPKKRSPSVLAVLCDGIGGHRAGEVAAAIGVRVITEIVAEGDPQRPLRTLEEAAQQANQAIYQASTSERGRLGMGTTCACAWVIDGQLFTMNLGDSRIYLLRDGHIIQLTTDHTWIQEALDAGVLTDPAPDGHPNAHVIRRYLGSEKPPEPDFRLWYFEGESNEEALSNQGLQLMPEDVLLLCSDGLTDLVSDEEIQEVIQNLPLDQATDRLISLANTRGGHDNTTVILLRYPDDGKKFPPKNRKRRFILGCLGALIIISAIITILFFGFRLRRAAQDEDLPVSPSATVPSLQDVLLTSQGDSPIPSPSWTSTVEGFDEGSSPSVGTRTPWPTNTSEP